MSRTIELDAGILAIDTEMAGLDQTVAAYLVPGDRPAVIETGPASVADALCEGLSALGVGPEDVATFIVSHIHLDHAGGAGDIVERFPRAQIVVHREGARHLADPSKLMASSYRVFGDALDRVFGPLRPVPSDRIRAVDAGDLVDVGGGRHLEIVEATGHARHHMAIQDRDSGVLFVGDAMGVYLPEADVLRPATPPPDFDLELALGTLQRFREREPSALYLTHFGPAPRHRDMLAEAEERIHRAAEVVRAAMAENDDLDHVAERLEDATRSDYAEILERPEIIAKFEALNAVRSTAAGILRYMQTHH